MIVLYLVPIFISSSFSQESFGCGFDDELHRKYEKNLFLNDIKEAAVETRTRRSTCWDEQGNIIPYYFESSIRKQNRDKIKRQMKKIEKNTCIQFRELRNDKISKTNHQLKINHTNNANDNSCNFAKVITYDSPQEVSFQVGGPNCASNLLMHELFHVLGLLHTHKRYDRDCYVRANKDCIDELYSKRILKDPSRRKDFERVKNDVDDTHDILYKCNSIMHYPEYWKETCNTFIVEPWFKKKDCIGGKVGMLEEPLQEDWNLINLEHCSFTKCSERQPGRSGDSVRGRGSKSDCARSDGNGGGGSGGFGGGGGGGGDSAPAVNSQDPQLPVAHESPQEGTDNLWDELVDFYKIVKSLQRSG